ncbi:phosphonoacetaldehyde hydrolase [Thalassotalea sp. 1_MG-2023]|uniref:phosphonoacetaldehyde hydrolase n=1 Tax=Thalassotalea sp. 1_MG-2023 TaxID=3062680 RepID=UPI0026E44C5C|nr:phosphonoacetaldehyde hydrolase [Thalassotalea sp. 1_MG-2023]MDO6425472.1 phosphonoacetaldehyde hydrolase [Thalassotalea sp. 1_MG-2023]
MSKIEAVVLDWAGTVVDYGSVAPTTIFVEAFKQAFNFEVSLDEARVPMGMGKWDHIKALGQLSSVDARWKKQFGQSMTDTVVDDIYQTFMPLQKAKVADHAQPIAGALRTIEWLKAHDIKVGSCSGYPREVMEILVPVAADYGYQPDAWVASDDLPAGSRPGPWMALQNVIELGVTDVANCIKFDDSAPGITEGLTAGMWTVGLALTGNAVGLTESEWQTLSISEQAALKQKAYDTLYQAGAHYVVDSLADAIPVIQKITAARVRHLRP